MADELTLATLAYRERVAALGHMAAGMLREIVNPVAAIDGYARAMVEAREGGDETPSRFDVSDILHEAKRLVAITREMAGLAELPATGHQLVSLNDIVIHSLALLRYEPRLQGVALVTRLDLQLPAIDAVPERLALLVTDLVTDAAKAGASRIEVATRAGDGVLLAVTDDGRPRREPPALAEMLAPALAARISLDFSQPGLTQAILQLGGAP